MATAKQTAKKPEDLDVAEVVAEVEVAGKSKAAPRSGAGRPNDTPILKPMVPNSTLSSRAKGQKRVGSALNKAVTADESASK